MKKALRIENSQDGKPTMTQKEQVLLKLEELGGYATLGQLYESLDFSKWKTHTPHESVRRILQNAENECYKIFPGLWGLKSMEKKIGLVANPKDEKFSHAYYQGLVCKLGKMRRFTTFVPAQDQNKKFLDVPLKEIADTTTLPEFTFPTILRRAKTVDVIWLRENNMPHSFYEIEHTTNIRNAIEKFCDLRDFYSCFYIVAVDHRERQFKEILSQSDIFKEMRGRIKFCSYKNLGKQYCAELDLAQLRQRI